MCEFFILISVTDTAPPDRVVCEHRDGHAGWHVGTLQDGRRYQWTTAEVPARGEFV